MFRAVFQELNNPHGINKKPRLISGVFFTSLSLSAAFRAEAWQPQALLAFRLARRDTYWSAMPGNVQPRLLRQQEGFLRLAWSLQTEPSDSLKHSNAASQRLQSSLQSASSQTISASRNVYQLHKRNAFILKRCGRGAKVTGVIKKIHNSLP
jgi:hypothetical protein